MARRKSKPSTDDTVIRLAILPTFKDFLANKTKRINVIYGGAGSGKSRSVADWLAARAVAYPGREMLIYRKTMPALKMTAYPMMIDAFDRMGVGYEMNKSEMSLTVGQSLIWFKSLDDQEKIKSMNITDAWGEEATEMTAPDIMQVNLRLRKPIDSGQPPHQHFLTFNPVDAFHFVITDLVNGNGTDVSVHHSTYKDNPFLPDEYAKQLEMLISKDENFYRVYALGLPGVLKNVVYSNYQIVEYHSWMPAVKDRLVARGLDWGFNDPMTIIAVYRHDGCLYIHEELYRSNMTTRDLVGWMASNNISRSVPIYADPSRPDQIEDLHREGYNIHPAENRIKDGIDYMKGQKLIISAESVNLIKEIRGYKYKENKDGRVLDEPVDFLNHALDAMRYGAYSNRPPSETSNIKPILPSDIGGWGSVNCSTPTFFNSTYKL